jgi:hypothetical protein
VTISNGGSTDATGVTFTDSVDTNTTLVPGSVNTQPIAIADSFNVIGNVRIQPNAAQGLLANDRDPDTGNNTGLTASGPTTTTQNGNITINTDGSFSYNPAPGFAGTDTVTYTITDSGGKTDTAVATFKVGNGTATPGTNVVWFVNPSAPAGGDGRLTNPFNCYTGGSASCFSQTAADDPGDTIFLFSGAHNGGNTLQSTQKLIGAGASDTLANIAGLTVPTGSDALPATGGASPTMTTTNVTAVTLGIDNIVRGFTIGNVGTGTKISGVSFGTLTVGNSTTPDVTLNGTGQALNLSTGTLSVNGGFASVTTTSSATQGINLAGVADSDGAGGSAFSFGSTSVSGATTQGMLIGTTTADINFGNSNIAGTTDAISFQNNSAGTRTFGTLTTTGGTGSAFLHGAGGGNVTVSGLASLSSAAANTIDIQNQAASTTVSFSGGATLTKSAPANTGINLNTDNGNVTFGGTLTIGTAGSRFPTTAVTINGGTTGVFSLGTVSIFTNGFAGITATNADGTINVTGGTVDVNAASALNISGPAGITTLGITLGTINSTGGTNNVNLTNTGGTVTLSGGALSGASGSSFVVSGSNPTVSFAGTLTQNNAQRVVDVQGTTGNSVSFTSTVTGGASSLGVHIGDTTAVNGNVSFTTLNLGTSGARMTNQAVTITNGGSGATYSLGAAAIFTNNAKGIVATNFDGTLNCSSTSTVDSSNATAIDIDGPAGLTTLGMTFVSVNSAGGTADGISIQDTTGTFTVNGDGSNVTVGGNGTGGTISNKSGADSNTTQGIGVFLNNTTGITLRRMTINGTNQNYGIRGNSVSNITVQYSTINGTEGTSVGLDEGSIIFDALTGTNTFTNLTVGGTIEDNFRVRNNTGTANDIIVTGSSFTGGANDNIGLEPSGTAVMTAHITNNTFTGAGGDHIQTTTSNTATLSVVITGNLYSGGFAGSLLQGITISGGNLGSAETVRFDVSNNGTVASPLVGSVQGGAININEGQGGGNWQGRVSNNVIGNPAVASSGSAQSSGIRVENHSTSGTLTATITNNTIRQWTNGAAINTQAGDAGNATNTGVLNVTVTGNTATNPVVASTQHGFVANIGAGSGSGTAANVACVDARTNTLDGNVANGGAGVRVRQREVSTVRIPGYTGTIYDSTAVATLLQTNNPGSVGPATASSSGTGPGFLNTSPAGSACTQPTVPTLPSSIQRSAIAQLTTFGEEMKAAADMSRDSGGDVATTEAKPVNLSEAVKVTGTVPATEHATIDSSQTVVQNKPVTLQNALVGESNHATARNESNTVTKATIRHTNAAVSAVNPFGAGGTVTVNIGTLAPGDSVTITFQVVIDNPYSGGPNVSNQGTISGSNFSNVLTDDPDIAGTNNPTLTPINSALIQVNDAKQAEPATGTSQMLFTLTSSTAAGAGGISVNYATANGGGSPATGGASCDGTNDYITASGTATIPSGSKTTTIPVTICSDANVEGDETLLMNISSPSSGNITDAQATGTITANTAGTFIISEFRTRGSAGAGDDFVEFYNNTNSPLTVAASDASAGYGVYKMGATCNDTPVLVGTIPNGTVIPARGHYLLVGSAYSLANYGGTGAAAGNQTLTSDIEDDRNVAVFSTANVANISSANRLDATGFTTNSGNVCDLMKEGTGLGPIGAQNIEYSYFRKECDFAGGCVAAGNPKDTNDNSVDFMFADTQGTFISGVEQHLGAPGPENLASPIRRDNAGILVPLLDSTKASSATPNRDRTFTPNPPTAPNGVLSIRRRIQNTTGATVTRLRFRVIEMTTFPSPGVGTADLRLITSTPVILSGITDPATCASTGTPTTVPCQVTAVATVLETPPAQPNGGGYNSTVTVSIPGGLANNASIDVNFSLGVVQGGTFRFYIIVEALP